METHLTQKRVTLKYLKVAEFASEETLCFTTSVLFDGEAVAIAHNNGHGDSTYLDPLKGKCDRLAEAETFAKSLPPDVIEHTDPKHDLPNTTIDITLDYLVDCLVESIHRDRKLRKIFQRDITNKVLFVSDRNLLFVKGARLKAITNKPAYFASLRAKRDKPIIILAELPADEAFALWKQHVVKSDPP